MRPVSPQPQLVNNRYGYGAGGYRAFLIMFILTGLSLIGLCYAFIRLSQTISNISENSGQVSEISENIEGNYQDYYPGVLGLYRMARKAPDRM
jgi:hypothetical protein